VDWPAVLPTKGPGFLAFALKGFALRLQEDGALRAYLPVALEPALVAGGYRMADAVVDADSNILAGRLLYRPKLRDAAKGNAVTQAAVTQAADASAQAMRMLAEHADAVHPLPYADVDLLKRRMAAAHPDVTISEVAGRDAKAVASIPAARAHQLAARTAWHAGAANQAGNHLRSAQQAFRAAAEAAAPSHSHVPRHRRQRDGDAYDDTLNQLLIKRTRSMLWMAATRRMWYLLGADYMSGRWDTADWVKYAKATTWQQAKLVGGVFLRHAEYRAKYAAKAEGRCAVAALATAHPGFVTAP
jgi:hypothetical protein